MSEGLLRTLGAANMLNDGSNPTAIWILALAVAMVCTIAWVFVPLMVGESGLGTTTAAAAFVSGVTPT